MTTSLTQTQPAKSPAIPKTVKSYLTSDYFKTQVALCLPKHMTAERFIRVAITATTREPKLLECTPESVVACCLALSELGLEPDGRRAHLIPYGKVCTLIVDYKGLVELAMNSGTVSSIFAERVCDKDEFTWDTGEIFHKINWREDRGKMYAVYVVIKFKDGGKHTEVMTRADVDRIRSLSKAGGNGPWVQHYDEMAKKTVFRRASKWVKLSPELHEALDKSENLSAVAPPSALVEIAEYGDDVRMEDLPPPAPAPEPTNEPPSGGPSETSPQPSTSRKNAPAVSPSIEPNKSVPQHELSVLVLDAGHAFDDLTKWLATEYWNAADADKYGVDTWSGFYDVPTQVAKTLLKAKAGLLQGLAGMKGQS